MAETDSSPKPELEALRELLDSQRESLIGKLDGLSDSQARATPTVSSMSLLGLIKHSAIWEQRWFEAIVDGRDLPDGWPDAGRPTAGEDPTFIIGSEDSTAGLISIYRNQTAISNEILNSVDLDGKVARHDAVDADNRWVALHMIEETARHAGHADIIRETIDGTTGR